MCITARMLASASLVLSVPLLLECPAVGGDTAGRVTTVLVSDQLEPVIARTDNEGNVHLLADSEHGPAYLRSSDGGRTFGPPIPVVDLQSQMPGLLFSVFDMAVAAGGWVHVAMSTNAWKLKLPQEEWGFQYARLEPGAKAFSAVRNLNRKPSEGFSLAADDQGNVSACWLADRLYANVSHDNGSTFGPNVEIDRAFDPCDCCTTSAAYGPDGRLAILYREETDNERDMYVVLWDQARGAASRTRIGSTRWEIDACPMTYYTISRDRDGFAAVWPTRGQIFFTLLDGDGKADLQPEIETPGRCGMRTGMLALCAPDGSTLVSWKKDGRLGWQLYDATGRPVGAAGSAPGSGAGAAGIVDKDGQFVLFR